MEMYPKTTHRVRIDGRETTLTYDRHSGSRGHQYLTPGNTSSHAFGIPLGEFRAGESFTTNGHRYEILSSSDVAGAGYDTTPTRHHSKVDLVGHNREHVKEYIRHRRPDAPQLPAVIDQLMRPEITREGVLIALAYAAGRASVVAEIEDRTIEDVCKDGY